MSQPPRWTIRRPTTILAASLLLLVVVAVPARAGSSIAPAEVPADAEHGLTLTVTEPEDEAYGDTAHVRVGAPGGFAVLACGSTPVGWSCTVAESGSAVTFVRDSPVSLEAASRDFGFTVHTAAVNGRYAFRVTQADGPPAEEEPPATLASRPVVTVIGGQPPPPTPSPTPSPTTAPTPTAGSGGAPTDGGSQTDSGGTTSGSDPQTDDPTRDTSPEADDTGSEADGQDTDAAERTGGSTAPRRTQGRASGTTLEVSPGGPTGDEPDLATPDVAGNPAIARTGGTTGTRDAAAVAASGAEASAEPRTGVPWQQQVGAAMLLAGLATLAARWLRQRRMR